MGKAGASTADQLKKGFMGAIQSATGLNIASLGLVGGLTAVGAGLAYSVKQAAESERVMAQTAAVIKSTGGAAGLTADQIGDMANRLSTLNAVDDEAIQSAENLLLTFKQIKADAFEPATQAAIDLSVALKMDLNSAAMMIGKALEDPVRGMTALRRAGVTFTADQQAVIKALVETGQAAKAQEMILAELNSQIGGSAAAAAKTYSGQMAALKNNVDNLAEEIGTALLPALTATTAKMNEWLILRGLMNDAEEEGIVSHQENADVLAAMKYGFMDLAAATKYVTDITTKYNAEIAESKRMWDMSAGTQQAFISSTKGSAEVQEELAKKVGLTGKAMAEAGRQTGGFRGELDDLSSAIAAGLAGKLQTAQENYKTVMGETTLEIARLTEEIAKYQAKQGQGFTVTEEATTSANEYELATLKAAAAVQKLTEYTGDDALELAQLKVNADHAQESVVKLGEGFGFSKDYTLDYTKKIQEASGSLAELEAKQAAAEAALRRTTAELILQQVGAALTGEALLLFARHTGIMSEADYNLAMKVEHLTEMYDLNGDGAVDASEDADGYAAALAYLYDKTVAETVALNDSKTPLETTAGEYAATREEADLLAAAANGVTAALNSIPKTVDININMKTNYTKYGDEDFGGWSPPVGTGGGGGGGGGGTGGGGGDPVYDGGMKGNSSGVTINQIIYNPAPANSTTLLQTARAMAGAW